MEKKIWSNQSSDEGDIIDLKATLFYKIFVTSGQLHYARVKNLYALKVPDACKALRRKE